MANNRAVFGPVNILFTINFNAEVVFAYQLDLGKFLMGQLIILVRELEAYGKLNSTIRLISSYGFLFLVLLSQYRGDALSSEFISRMVV